jgi:hypothetical protein
VKPLLTIFCLLSIAITVCSQPTQQQVDNPSTANVTKLADEIKALLDTYSTALASYKGQPIKDTAVTRSQWFRALQPFTLASSSVIELEDNGYELYLTFQGFSKPVFAMGFAQRLKNKLLASNYSFGQLKEEASGEDGLWYFVQKNPTSNKKMVGVGMYIHVPNENGLKDKFGNKREKDVVVRIGLPS